MKVIFLFFTHSDKYDKFDPNKPITELEPVVPSGDSAKATIRFSIMYVEKNEILH